MYMTLSEKRKGRPVGKNVLLCGRQDAAIRQFNDLPS